jgi:hypothetical protein
VGSFAFRVSGLQGLRSRSLGSFFSFFVLRLLQISKHTEKGNKRMTGVDEDFLGELQKANVSGAAAKRQQG